MFTSRIVNIEDAHASASLHASTARWRRHERPKPERRLKRERHWRGVTSQYPPFARRELQPMPV
jgi:hypothetical protein